MKFYYIDHDYLTFLNSKYESKVMKPNRTGFQKFVFGVVIEIGGIKYYAPVSSVDKSKANKNHLYKKDKRGNLNYSALNPNMKSRVFPIHNNDSANEIIAIIRLDYMFPVHEKNLTLVEFEKFNTTQKEDQDYKNLLEKEYEVCKTNQANISKKAHDIYNKSKSPTHIFAKCCCNFNMLEIGFKEWVCLKGF